MTLDNTTSQKNRTAAAALFTSTVLSASVLLFGTLGPGIAAEIEATPHSYQGVPLMLDQRPYPHVAEGIPARIVRVADQTLDESQQAFKSEMAEFYGELETGTATIRNLLEQLGDMSSTSLNDALAAADNVLDITSELDTLMAPGAALDLAFEQAKSFLENNETQISQDPLLTPQQKQSLITALSKTRSELSVEMDKVDRLRSEMRIITANVRQDRQFIAYSTLVAKGDDMVVAIQQLSGTMTTILDMLNQISEARQSQLT